MGKYSCGRLKTKVRFSNALAFSMGERKHKTMGQDIAFKRKNARLRIKRCKTKLVPAVIGVLILSVSLGTLSTAHAQGEKDNKSGSINESKGSRNGGRGRITRYRRSRQGSKGRSTKARKIDIYRVRVTVIDSDRRPVDDAKVWSSWGGESKKVSGGWQFDIPASGTPLSGKLTFFATKDSAFLQGESELELDIEPNPAVIITLQRNTQKVFVRGIIIDGSNNAIAGVRVSVVGYESETVITQESGSFVLPAHAAKDQQILLHAEKIGYKAVTQYHPAGDEPATIILERQ